MKRLVLIGTGLVLLVSSAVILLSNGTNDEDVYMTIAAVDSCGDDNMQTLRDITGSSKHSSFNRAFANRQLYTCNVSLGNGEAAIAAGEVAVQLFTEAGDETEATAMQATIDAYRTINQAEQTDSGSQELYEQSLDGGEDL